MIHVTAAKIRYLKNVRFLLGQPVHSKCSLQSYLWVPVH